MILWFKDRGIVPNRMWNIKRWKEQRQEADVVIEHNVIIKNRFGRFEIGITDTAINDLRTMALTSQLEFFRNV